jgi:hypothetical protein
MINKKERNLLLVKMKEKNLLELQPLPKVLRMQAVNINKDSVNASVSVSKRAGMPRALDTGN